MSLLELEHVKKRRRRGRHTIELLTDVSLELDAGELVALWGQRGSGRSTLLRIAAGIETPDAGTVRFRDRDQAGCCKASLPDGLAFCRAPQPGRDPIVEARTVLETLTIPQLARGIQPRPARARALAALRRADVLGCEEAPPHDLAVAETARLRIAAALCSTPTLLLIDEPTTGIDLLDRDAVFDLLRQIAADGTAILACVSETTSLYGVDRALTLSEGELHGELTPRHAPVVELPMRQSA